MPRFVRSITVFLALGLAAACGGKERQDFIQAYTGAPYMGRVGVRITPPAGSGRRSTTDSGQGSAQFTSTSGNQARLIVVGNIRGDADAGFVLDGTYDDSGWKSKVGDVRLEIGPDGTISGGGEAPPHRFRFGGTMTKEQALLEVDLELLKSSEGGFPPGTHFVFDYRLERRVAAADDESERESHGSESDDAGDCKRVEYRLKSVPNPFGGSMGLVRVPECIR